MEETKEKVNSISASDPFLKAKQYNSKTFPIYKLFGWDLLFYYSVSFLFFTQVKGLSVADVLVADAFYQIVKVFCYLFDVGLVGILGNRKSLILGNVLVALSIAIVLLPGGMFNVLLSMAIMAFGYSLKGLCDSALLRESTTFKKEPASSFARLDGKGSAYWYAFDAITAISCGFLFVFHPYLPMVLCFVMCIISCIIAFSFKSCGNTSESKKLKNRRLSVTMEGFKIRF